jgi:peroxiredoxin
MKKIFSAVMITAVLFSCNTNSDKGRFTLDGDLKSSPDQKIYLEELYFSEKQPEVLDTGEIKNGKFVVSAIAPEEGLFRIRTEDEASSLLFINEESKMNFTGIANNHELTSSSFSGAANSSLKKLLQYIDSIGLLISNKNKLLTEFLKAGVKESDSTFMAVSNDFKTLNNDFTKFSFAYADTAKSPIVSLFAATMAPVELSKFETPLAKLVKRFPDHKGIAGALAYIKKQASLQSQTQSQPQQKAAPAIGDQAPELIMNDVDGNSYSLSQLKGKFVLVDFWASWCGPCRDENPNVVAAFNQFKDKNFTVLGVSLDNNKDAWIGAIKEDKLNWQHISDLKKWNSAAVGLFGLSGIPYNVLVDPQGKIIATGLRESDLQNKLAEVLK